MRLLALLLCVAALPVTSRAAERNKTTDRLDDASTLFGEIMSTPDKTIPQSLLNRSHCIVLVPGLKKGGFVVAGKYGRGFVTCRQESGQGWGPPAAVRIEGGSFGLQAGLSSTDLVLLVMNERGMKRLLSDKFTLGADASVAAGPVGRDTTAQTDPLMTAEILSWSRSHGVFAGISLDGSTLRSDLEVNTDLYHQPWTNQQILSSGAAPPPPAAKLLALLNKYSPRRAR